MRENGGSHTYHALTTQLERKWSRGLSFMGAYTWAKSLTDVDETGGVEGGTTIENAFDRRRERGDAQYFASSPLHLDSDLGAACGPRQSAVDRWGLRLPR